jgi:hypothetical protein
MSFAEIPIRFLVLKRESNIENHIRWLEYIAGPQFIADWTAAIQTGGNMRKMVASARQIVEELIYAFNTTAGTGRIKKSFIGTYTEGANPGFAIYSDPSIAPAKGPVSSGNPEDFSYAAFFEDPKFNTFIPPKDDPLNQKRYRPFFQAMASDQQRLGLQVTFQALLRTIKRRMPKV